MAKITDHQKSHSKKSLLPRDSAQKIYQNGGSRNTKYWVDATRAGLETAVVVLKFTSGQHTGKTSKSEPILMTEQ